MKLEVNHIAPYVEHGLMTDKGMVRGVELFRGEWCLKCEYNTIWHKLTHIKPLLKPLSELSDEEIDEIERREGIDCVNIIGFRTETLEYRTFQDLVSKHYDVFGLIDNGLAEVKE